MTVAPARSYDRSDWASAFVNVEEELTDVALTPVRGAVPTELQGTLYRNGPGRLERDGHRVHHPFDGDGMIAAMRFENGSVCLSNRFVRTEGWLAEEKAGKVLYRGVFGSQKPGGRLANAFDLRLKNIANTNVVRLGDQLLALWEAAEPHALDPCRRPEAGALLHDRSDSFPGFAFLHDFAITPNWAVFLQNAIAFNPLPFVTGEKGAAQCLASQPGGKGRFWLIPRDSGRFAGQKPRILEAPDGFVFHHLNAFEDGDHVVVESIVYDDFPSIGPDEDFAEVNFDTVPEGILHRCRLDLSRESVQTERISERTCEFAMVNPERQGLSARFAWMAVAERERGNDPLQAIQKLDLDSGETHTWSAAPRGFVSEPLMVRRPGAEAEDDGWVLDLVWNGARAASDLVILNARDLSEVAVLELPLAVPHGLHGSWAPIS